MPRHSQRAYQEFLLSLIALPIVLQTLQIDVQVDNHHLLDHIEWDLRSGLTPEEFTHQLCLDLGLAGEAEPLIAHAVHEELMKHKKDAIEWGVIGGFPMEQAATAEDGPKDKSALGVMKDKTGLGLGWGRTPKEGRGPRVLRSVWRDWAEAEEFNTRWEMLSHEEVERREVERERASRCGARYLIFIRIISLTPGSLQAVTERNIEIPKFDQNEEDTILARHYSGVFCFSASGRTSYCFIFLLFVVIFGLGLVIYY